MSSTRRTKRAVILRDTAVVVEPVILSLVDGPTRPQPRYGTDRNPLNPRYRTSKEEWLTPLLKELTPGPSGGEPPSFTCSWENMDYAEVNQI